MHLGRCDLLLDWLWDEEQIRGKRQGLANERQMEPVTLTLIIQPTYHLYQLLSNSLIITFGLQKLERSFRKFQSR